MTVVKQDTRGLYVMIDGQRARPGATATAAGRDMSAGTLKAGQHVRAAYLPAEHVVRLRYGAAELFWSTQNSARLPATPQTAAVGRDGRFQFRAGQVYVRYDGMTSRVAVVLADGGMVSTGGIAYSATGLREGDSLSRSRRIHVLHYDADAQGNTVRKPAGPTEFPVPDNLPVLAMAAGQRWLCRDEKTVVTIVRALRDHPEEDEDEVQAYNEGWRAIGYEGDDEEDEWYYDAYGRFNPHNDNDPQNLLRKL